jgi:hypothetical protein
MKMKWLLVQQGAFERRVTPLAFGQTSLGIVYWS